MKTIKSVLVLIMLLLGSISFGQPPGGGRGHQGPPPVPNDKQIEKMVDDLADAITISDEQEMIILDLYKAHFKSVKEKTSGNSRPKREEMDALQAAFEKKVKTELTDSQQIQYEAYLKKQSEKRPPRR